MRSLSVRLSLLALVSLAPLASGQTSILQRFVFDDTRDPFERTLGENDAFGGALASMGDLNGDGLNELAVGAPLDQFETGAVWLFSVRTTRQIAKFVKLGPAELLPFDLGFNDHFGSAVVSLGDLDGNGVGDIAVGAPGDDDGVVPPLSGAGAVYVLFLNVNGTIAQHLKFSKLAGGFAGKLDPDDHFGAALAAPGDLDGNGVPDLVVGAPGDDDGGIETGALWVLFFAADRSVIGEQKIGQLAGGMQGALTAREGFGAALGTLGDLDDDGLVDLVAGSLRRSGAREERLRVLFMQGGGSVASHTEVTGLVKVGHAVVGLGDVDGDSVEDLAAGTRIVLMNADGSMKANHALPGAPYDGYSAALAAPGDTNGDGRVELLIGSPGADVRARNSGAFSFCEIAANGVPAAVLSNVDATTSLLPIAPLELYDDSDSYGTSIATLGDLDGDGLAEVAVGAVLDDDGAIDAGAVWLHFISSGSGHRVEKLSRVQSQLPLDFGDRFGQDIAGLGDLDGDGTPDLAVAAPWDDDGHADAGAVYVLFLAPNGAVARRQKLSLLAGGFSGPSNLFRLGIQLEQVGDLDGDGRVELAVSDGPFSSTIPDSVWILFLRPDGTVRAQTLLDRTVVPSLGTGTLASQMAAWGENAGGQHELVTAGFSSSIRRLWRLTLDSGGQIQSAVVVNNSSATQAMASLGDLDGDGDNDLALLSGSGVSINFLNPDLTVQSSQFLRNLGGSLGLGALGDVTGDGLDDLAYGGTISGHDRVLLLSLDGKVRWTFEHEDSAAAPDLPDGYQIPRPHPGRAFVISSSGANLGAALFDSDPSGPNAGNDLCVDSGNVLVLQDSLAPSQSTPGVFDHPADDPDGGVIAFDFPGIVRALSLDLADLDPFPLQGAEVTLVDDADRTRVYDVPAGWTGLFGSSSIRTLDLTTLAPQPGAGPWPAMATQQIGFQAARVVRIEVVLFDGGALDVLRFDPHP